MLLPVFSNTSGLHRFLFPCSKMSKLKKSCTLTVYHILEWMHKTLSPIYFAASCPGVSRPSNGQGSYDRSSINGRYSVGTKVTYSCNDGYEKQHGWYERVCQEDKTWLGWPLVCVAVVQGNVIWYACIAISLKFKTLLYIYKCKTLVILQLNSFLWLE